jgi:hypothetical protein
MNTNGIGKGLSHASNGIPAVDGHSLVFHEFAEHMHFTFPSCIFISRLYLAALFQTNPQKA